MPLPTDAYFLGGHDLEMVTIAALLAEKVSRERVFDKHLSWGARLGEYAAELQAARVNGWTPVLIELTLDIPAPPDAVVIDHHNDRAGMNQPTSLEQIFERLQLPQSDWSRQFALVAANDRGYLPEMTALGATAKEMQEIRAADRQAQGITAVEETAAQLAVNERETIANGHVTLVQLPHERTAAAADRMEPQLGGPGYENLLIVTPTGVSFYGHGSLIELLHQKLPGGWSGGALPVRGFWGRQGQADRAIQVLEENFETN